jgi:hypothetical protein
MLDLIVENVHFGMRILILQIHLLMEQELELMLHLILIIFKTIHIQWNYKLLMLPIM